MKFKWPSQLLVSAIALSGVMVSPARAQYPGMPSNSGYPGMPSNSGYPGMPSNPGHPGMPSNPGYPGVPSNSGYPGMPSNPGYPVIPSDKWYPGIPSNPVFSSTSFVCGQIGGSPATLVQVNGQTLLLPLIIWETASYDMSPEQRCQMVSWRMTRAVSDNGGKLSNLLLTTGKINGYNVICFVNAAESCNFNNVIMTLLRRENARNPGNVLTRIIRFGRNGTGLNIIESGGFTAGVVGQEEIIPTAVSIEEAINQLVNESGGMPTAPAPGGYTAPAPGGGPI
nr:COP23 domain-containing protein [Nostoc sp. SerVER01]